jgi:hypothetical protein
MVKSTGVPGQLPIVVVGVTRIVAIIGAFVELVAVNEAIFPVPLPASEPMEAPVFVQLYVTPLVMLPVKFIASVGVLSHLV